MVLLDTTQLSEKLGLSKGALHQLRRREASFPAPIKVSQKFYDGTKQTLKNG